METWQIVTAENLVVAGAYFGISYKIRQRQALEINDNLVQGLTIAKYELDRGKERSSRKAIEETLRKARGLITELLGEADGTVHAGELRRSRSATVAPDAEREP